MSSSATITTSAAAAAAAAVAAMFPGGLGSFNPKDAAAGLNQMSNLGGMGSPLSNFNASSRSSTGSMNTSSLTSSTLANPLLSLSSLSPNISQSGSQGIVDRQISVFCCITKKFMLRIYSISTEIISVGGMNTKPHSLNPYENMSGSSMSGTPIRPKPTNELKAVSMSTLVPSPIQPSPALSLPPGMLWISHYSLSK